MHLFHPLLHCPLQQKINVCLASPQTSSTDSSGCIHIVMTQLRMMAYMEKAVALIFFLGAFETFIANLHLSSRELTRLVLIKDYILNLKTQSLMACRCKTPWFLLLIKGFFCCFCSQEMRSSSFLQCTLLGGKLPTYEEKEAGGEGIIYSILIFLISLY